jgi:hypothetical protein
VETFGTLAHFHRTVLLSCNTRAEEQMLESSFLLPHKRSFLLLNLRSIVLCPLRRSCAFAFVSLDISTADFQIPSSFVIQPITRPLSGSWTFRISRSGLGALAEWLTRCPAISLQRITRGISFGSKSSNLLGVEFFCPPTACQVCRTCFFWS